MYFTDGTPLKTQAALPSLSSVYELYVRSTGVRANYDFGILNLLSKYFTSITTSNLYFWPINEISPFTNLYGGTDIAPSNSYEINIKGIRGDGAEYFQLINSNLLDINNFSIGVHILDNTNAGIDVGCTDGTNIIKFAVRDSGNTKIQVGTGSDVFANSDSTGLWVLNVRAGSVYIYKDYKDASGSSFAVGGSNPDRVLYLAANNNDGTAVDYTTRTYGCVFIYNGLLSQTEVFKMMEIMYFYSTKK